MSSPAGNHPSYLALDRAALGDRTLELEAHLASCTTCRQYLEGLEHPHATMSFADVEQRIQRMRSATRRRWWAAVPLAAAACALLFALSPKPPAAEEPTLYVAAKGLPTVWIYVKRGATTQLWDGKSALHGGDRIRLKVDADGFRHVEVYSVPASNQATQLYAGKLLPGQVTTLPDAWEIDAEPGSERIVVVLSDQHVEPEWGTWLGDKPPAGVSLMPFVLPKSSPADSAGDSGAP